MVTTILLWAFALACVLFLLATRKPKTRDGMAPFTPAQRLYHWRQRLDAQIGSESEEAMRMHARGVVVKRRLIAQLRNIDADKAMRKRHPQQVPRKQLKLRLTR